MGPNWTPAEGFVLGVGAKMFTIAGPVIVYGVSASVVYGFIYWITTLFYGADVGIRPYEIPENFLSVYSADRNEIRPLGGIIIILNADGSAFRQIIHIMLLCSEVPRTINVFI